ncbi:MAG: FAD-dependent oxidoreductase [Desulfobacteraceae bacterium]|nr:FAD-dependent oxidoreductase [Desulfobacteraceae bacterium]
MRIAVIGSGISGMVSAYLLSQDHDIVLYEANDYIGGHTHTIDVPIKGVSYPVDTGFIVFNEKTYPNFIKLMRSLGVAWQPSNMSFSVQCDQTGLVFSPSTLNGLFVQRKNLFRPSFYRMLWDALRFRREASELIRSDDYSITLQDYLEQRHYSHIFIEHFIIPMGGAIWSADPVQFRKFPARYLVEFFYNHGFLNVRHQPQWLVIKGGSSRYIGPLTRPYKDRIRLNSPVASVKRSQENVEITTKVGDTATFDHVVIATHSDQALQMLTDPSDLERDVLGAIPYQENLAVLHTDKSVLPPKRAAWASWNYHIPKEEKGRVALTYDMNILQSLGATEEFCVTLNMPEKIHPDRIIQSIIYHHPVYDPNSLSARRKQDEINGKNRTYFCGAYWGYGFHEDGVNSALSVCKHFGKTLS